MNFKNVTEGVVFCSFLEQTCDIHRITVYQQMLDESLNRLITKTL